MNDRPSLTARLLGAVRLVAACTLTAVALLYAVLCVKLTLVDMTEDACSAGGCPRGLGPLVLWALGAAAGAGLLWWAALRGRPYRSLGGWAVAVVVSFAALVPAWQGFSWLRGPLLVLFSYQVPEGPAAGRPLGSWGQEAGSVIRVRTDGVTEYNGEGRHGWSIGTPPDGAQVCAMSPQPASRTGLLGYAGGGPCGSRVVAVDLTSGLELWAADVPDPSGGMSVAGSLAVTGTADAVVARDLRTGAERWRSPLPAGAAVTDLLAGPDRVLAIARSAAGSELLALDPRTGTRTGQTPLPAGIDPPRLVSAGPTAAVIAGGRLLLHDGSGRPLPDARTEYVPSADGRRLVLGEVLVVAVPEREKREVLAAFSLTDGRPLWRRSLGHDYTVRTLSDTGTGRIEVVSQGSYTHLWDLDPRTGTPAGEPAVLRDLPLGEAAARYGSTFVNLDPGGALPPIFDVTPVLGW
ncbi:PQQ-binding-like beta-propeller repeat protein [Streptomyces sp. NPDC029216]|uniref:outer membrane protein assembly factor BamB family protein n=1 Tax=Streptomyces sp. NPDC029216 TaxID=3154701 RepID=UPI003401FFB2